MINPSYNITRNTTIKELAKLGILSVRTINVLQASIFDTIGEVADFLKQEPEGLLKLRNFGFKSQAEIMELMSTYDLAQVESNPKQNISFALPPILESFISDLYQSVIEENNPVTNYFGTLYPNYKSFWDAIMDNNNNFLLIHKDLGKDGTIELRNIYISLLTRIESIVVHIPVQNGERSDLPRIICYQKNGNLQEFFRKTEKKKPRLHFPRRMVQ